MTHLLDGLNDAQREAVTHIDGPLLILAGAGSGKTSVITRRAAYLIEQGVDPYRILAITFTNKAAKEMRERVDRLTERGGQVWVSTFHSMCVRILRRHIDRLGYDNRFTIYDADDALRLMKNTLKELDLSDKQFPPKSVMNSVSGWKNELLTPQAAGDRFGDDFRAAKMVKAYGLYQQMLKGNNALDFDDLIFKTAELFESCPDVLGQYQQRFAYIMVDEYQDTNTAQYRLVSLLAKGFGNLCVVGDDDQSIYGWRGANIRNILDFEKEYKNCRVVKLERNYRSTQVILDAANSVIRNNTRRKHKAMWTSEPGGAPVNVFNAGDEAEEAAFVAERIIAAVKDGGKYADHAVLYRSNAQSRAIEERLVAGNVPYRLFGGVRFYERKEVKDVLAYLRVINNARDSVSLLRIINVPRRGIGSGSVDKLSEYARERDVTLFDAMAEAAGIDGLGSRGKKFEEFHSLLRALTEYAQTHTVTELLGRVLEDTEYIAELLAEGTEEAKGRVENVEELSSKAAQFEAGSEDKSLSAFLEELALVADIDSYTEADDTATLMTLHSAKGLEFPCVFMVGMEEGVFPSGFCLTSGDLNDLEEERRICYVGITRARQRLYMTAARTRMRHGQRVWNAPSRFLQEIPEELMEQTSLSTNQNNASQNNAGQNTASQNTASQNTANQKNKKERTGISQFAEVNKVKNAIDISFGGKNYQKPALPDPANVTLDFAQGDRVRQMKYGIGVVREIRSAGADYEVTVEFENVGEKKIMAKLSKLKKVED